MLLDVGDPIPIARDMFRIKCRYIEYDVKCVMFECGYALVVKKPLEPKLAREAQLLLP